MTVNPVLQTHKYLIPKVEDLLTVLAGGQKFSKLDFSQAYQQMLLHPDDQYHNNQHSPGSVPIYKSAIWHCVSARNLPTSDGEDTTRLT